MREISWLAEDLFASQKGPCSVELVSYFVGPRPLFYATAKHSIHNFVFTDSEPILLWH